MKTSIDLPDDVLHKAKVVAAQRRTTLKGLILRGLRREIESSDPAQEETEALINALAKGRNAKAVGQLGREDIYDRSILHRH